MWVLLIYIYAGPLADGDSVAMQSVGGWMTEKSCNKAGEQAEALVNGSTKELRFICFNTNDK